MWNTPVCCRRGPTAISSHLALAEPTRAAARLICAVSLGPYTRSLSYLIQLHSTPTGSNAANALVMAYHTLLSAALLASWREFSASSSVTIRFVARPYDASSCIQSPISHLKLQRRQLANYFSLPPVRGCHGCMQPRCTVEPASFSSRIVRLRGLRSSAGSSAACGSSCARLGSAAKRLLN
jgi:hypothetical protein